MEISQPDEGYNLGAISFVGLSWRQAELTGEITGMGVLRRTLRDFLRKHPHVTDVTEPPHNEGGQGATVVELRQ